MPMKREEHEALLNELLNAELEQSRRTEILQKLRVDHVTAHTEVEDLTTNNNRLQKHNDDLIVSNSQLFRELGYVGENKKPEEVEQKEFSETISIEELERG